MANKKLKMLNLERIAADMINEVQRKYDMKNKNEAVYLLIHKCYPEILEKEIKDVNRPYINSMLSAKFISEQDKKQENN